MTIFISILSTESDEDEDDIDDDDLDLIAENTGIKIKKVRCNTKAGEGNKVWVFK